MIGMTSAPGVKPLLRQQPDDVGTRDRQAETKQHEYEKDVRRDRAVDALGIGFAHRLEHERSPGRLQGVRDDLQSVPDSGAHTVQTHVLRGRESDEQVPVADRDDLLGGVRREARQTQADCLAAQRPREHWTEPGAGEACQHAAEHGGDDQIRHHHARHPPRENHHGHDAQQQRGCGAREHQRCEVPRAILRTEALEWNEVERHGERLDQDEPQQIAVRRFAEEVLREPGRGQETGARQRRHDGKLQQEDRPGEPLPMRRAARAVVQAQERRA